MTRFDIKGHLDWERGLNPGDVVEARWTNCHSYYVAKAEVVRVNQKSMRVKLVDGIEDRYPAGHELSIATFMSMDRWSINNGAFPHEETA